MRKKLFLFLVTASFLATSVYSQNVHQAARQGDLDFARQYMHPVLSKILPRSKTKIR